MAGVVLTLGQSSVVLANGDDVHLGNIQIPMVAVWVGGGLIVVFLLGGFFLWTWGSRSLKRKEEKERQLQSADSNTMTSESDDTKQEG